MTSVECGSTGKRYRGANTQIASYANEFAKLPGIDGMTVDR
jgi:hypothetical protein